MSVDVVTFGQYLRPSLLHLPVREHVTPARFAALEQRVDSVGQELANQISELGRDIDGLAEAKSAREDEPGIVFDKRRRALEICWTGWVGRNFQKALATTSAALGTCRGNAAGLEAGLARQSAAVAARRTTLVIRRLIGAKGPLLRGKIKTTADPPLREIGRAHV